MVGSAIVPLVLALSDAEVQLLIRADSDAALAERLEDLVAYWGWTDDPAMRQRVRGLRGDAALPRFGLSERDYAEVAAACSHIIHSAGTVRMNLELEDARRSAVGSTMQILALARQLRAAGHLAKVEFVSTVGIAGRRAGILHENRLEQMPPFHNTYEQAKAEAEELVKDAIQREHLPITVHRPSMVVGDSRDGRVIHFQIFYFLCEFLSGRRTAGLYPDFGTTRLDIIPSDTVAAAIVEASRDPASAGRIFHLCSGQADAPVLEDIKEAVRQAWTNHGIAVPRPVDLPLKWYGRLARLAALISPPRYRRALSTLPIYLDYLTDRQGFDNDRFVSWFRSKGHGVPNWRDYVPRVLDFYLDQHLSDNGAQPPRSS